MAKRVFFSFHYADVWRVNQVRNSWVVRGERESAGFVDKAEFEAVERQGVAAVEKWIDSQLDGTSVTIVLIGNETATRPYVQYEIRRSYERNNALLGIYIDNIKGADQLILPTRGANPFDRVQVGGSILGGSAATVATKLQVPVYDWVNNDGRANIARWIELAPKKDAGR